MVLLGQLSEPEAVLPIDQSLSHPFTGGEGLYSYEFKSDLSPRSIFIRGELNRYDSDQCSL